MLSADQVGNRLIAGNKCRVHRIGRKEISIAGAEGVSLMADAKLQFTTKNPMRLIFGMSVRAILSAGRVAPLKYAVAFIPKAGL